MPCRLRFRQRSAYRGAGDELEPETIADLGGHCINSIECTLIRVVHIRWNTNFKRRWFV